MDNTETSLDALTRDWRRLRHQKHRAKGGVEAGMMLDYLLYEGEHQSVQVQNAILTRAFRHERDKNKLRLVINLARRLADRKIGRLWSIAHKYRATPNTKDPVAFDYADVISDQLIPAMDYKMQQDTLRWLINKFVVICGVAFEHVDYKEGCTQDVLPKYDEVSGAMLWTDSLTGQEITEEMVQQIVGSGMVAAERFKPATEVQRTGDVGGDIYDPFRVFIDASVPMVKKLGPGQRVYLADIRSRDWIEETFGSEAVDGLEPNEDLSIIETQLLDRGTPVAGLNLKDLLPLIHGSKGKDDPDMYVVITAYSPTSNKFPEGTREFFVPGQKILDADDNPYPEIPVIDYHWSAPGTTMWTTGFMRDFHALSKFVNKRFSQLGEAANAQIYEMLLLGDGLAAKDIPTDFPGVVKNGINADTGMPNVQVVPRGTLPSFFPESIRLSMETLEGMGGSDLLSQRKFPGQLRGSLTVPMLQEIMDSEDGPRYSHLAEQFALEKLMRINRIKQFYPPIRTLTYTGEDLRNEVLEFHSDEILRAGVDFTISVDPGSILPEFSAMREARVRERMQWAPGLYTNPRTGQMDWSKVANDLKYNDKQREGIEGSGRKLARQLIQRIRKGQLTVKQGQQPDPKTGQPVYLMVNEDDSPFIVFPVWPHNSMMDEYEAIMLTTEFIDASPMFRRVLMTLHDKHRLILTQIDQARQASVENKMVQGAMAQASQQAAAKAASMAVEMAMSQVETQQTMGDSGQFAQLQDQVRQLLGSANGAGMRPEPSPVGRGTSPRAGMVRKRLG